MNGQVEVAEMLIKNDAAVDAVDGWGATPLHQASSRGQLAMAEKLLAAGANPNAEDIQGERPLHYAAKTGDYALVKLLLSYGADASLKARATGKTPADWAKPRWFQPFDGSATLASLCFSQYLFHWLSISSEFA